jgi:hypothetical protein
VTDSAAPNVDDSDDIYLSRLNDEDRATYLRASGDADLAREIRLVRTAIAGLSPELQPNLPKLRDMLGVLCRAVGLQVKTQTGATDIEQALLAAADEALALLEARTTEPEGTAE